MHLQILHAPADLAAPSVALQYLAMQFSIARRIESQWRVLGWDLLHEACPATSDLLLFAGQELVVAGDGLQQGLR